MLEHDASDPFDLIHPNGGLVDAWIMDDQTIICDPKLVNPIIDAVDQTCQRPERGGVRNRIKTTSSSTPHPDNTNYTNTTGTWTIFKERQLSANPQTT